MPTLLPIVYKNLCRTPSSHLCHPGFRFAVANECIATMSCAVCNFFRAFRSDHSFCTQVLRPEVDPDHARHPLRPAQVAGREPRAGSAAPLPQGALLPLRAQPVLRARLAGARRRRVVTLRELPWCSSASVAAPRGRAASLCSGGVRHTVVRRRRPARRRPTAARLRQHVARVSAPRR